MGDDFARVNEGVDIVDLVGREVGLTRKGKDYVGLCPFHDDHTPSMSVSPTKRIFKCWSCGTGGDAIKFTTLRYRMTPAEALHWLADTYHIPLSRSSHNERRNPDLYDMLEDAARFFEESLPDSPAERYLVDQRKINHETIKLFRLGFAPDSWEVPSVLQGEKLKAAEQTGLVRETSDGSGRKYSFFRNRVMFPILDSAGRVIAFAGRTLNSREPAKYLNSPQSDMYEKSKILYGVPQASRRIRETGEAVIVEGYVDVVSAHQAGVSNTIATGGVALTDDHVQFLVRYPNVNFLFAFDGDEAGRRAALGASKKVLGKLDAGVCVFPDGEDPAEIAERGGDLGAALRTHRIPLSEFFVRETSRGKDLGTAEGLTAFLTDIAPSIQGVPRKAQGVYIELISKMVNVSAEAIESHVLDLPWRLRTEGMTGRAYWESLLIQQLGAAASARVISYVENHVRSEDFTVPEARELYQFFLRHKPDEGSLFAEPDAPLFQAPEFHALADTIREEARERGVTLNKNALLYLLQKNSEHSAVSIGHVERSVMMIRTLSLMSRAHQAVLGGANFTDFAPALNSLEKILRGDR